MLLFRCVRIEFFEFINFLKVLNLIYFLNIFLDYSSTKHSRRFYRIHFSCCTIHAVHCQANAKNIYAFVQRSFFLLQYVKNRSQKTNETTHIAFLLFGLLDPRFDGSNAKTSGSNCAVIQALGDNFGRFFVFSTTRV